MQRLLGSFLVGSLEQSRESGHWNVNFSMMGEHFCRACSHITRQAGMGVDTCSVHMGAYSEQRKNFKLGILVML
ncbi:hypothetical protein DPEC_G00262920 [Dallia pectoralis]|uniref:Uncharacterized protein n=1 Tax=Dallia pectoralis TaxID=75939 RepID=A0ACC2FS03_DALPE|nr:hypothetical protein DPEC_G00262920 [Dallia pectoralis]